VDPVRIVVDSRVRLPISALPEHVADAIRAAFTHPNPAYPSKNPDEPAVYRTWKHEDDDLTVPRGGMARVRSALRAGGIAWAVEDRRTWEHPAPNFPDHKLELRAFQGRMIDAAEAKQNCLLRAHTGVGKTTALLALLARLKRRALVQVWTANLAKQWIARCGSELGIHEDDVGEIRGNITRISPWVTIAMQQTLFSRFERGDDTLVDQFDVVALDECQRGGAPSVSAAVDPFRARYRIGISADETRHDEKEMLIYDVFGDVACEVGEAEAIESGATVDVEIYVVPTKFAAPWYRYRTDFNRLLEQMTADEERNAIALRIAKTVVDQGEQVLLFTHRIEHARTLDSKLVGMGIRSGVLLGGKEQEVVFERSAAGFRSGDHRAGVGTYGAIAQGIDLPSVSRGILITPISNNRQQVNQCRGRICRASDGKGFGRLYVLLDGAIYQKKPVRNFVEWFPTVKVLEGRTWLDGREWLRRSGIASASGF
jgi:superfamily II DNA or RNA helicase